ncbi:MAG: hypothetical protein ACLRS8_00495 [Parabacteroides merdae]
MSHNHSYWVERNPEVDIAPWIKEKDDLSPIYGWKTNGIFQSPEEVQQYTSNGKVLQPDSYAGNKKFVDINGDGVLNDDDIVKLGSNEPKMHLWVRYEFPDQECDGRSRYLWCVGTENV